MKAPGCGILFNGALQPLLPCLDSELDFVSVIPVRLWEDAGRGTAPRCRELPDEVSALEALAARFPLIAHGIALSIASASTFDTEHLQQLANWHQRYPFRWISEHLSAVRVHTESTDDHHAGLALPVPWD